MERATGLEPAGPLDLKDHKTKDLDVVKLSYFGAQMVRKKAEVHHQRRFRLGQ